jgi:hypothetical protein
MDFSFKRITIHLCPWIWGSFFLVITLTASAQEVEHNYPVGPQNTSCDSLNLVGLSGEKMIQFIEMSSFRFDQQFKISRISGIQAGHFYSCDGKTGYLILTIDKKKKLLVDLPKTIWDEFIQSSDLDGFYEKHISGHYRMVED